MASYDVFIRGIRPESMDDAEQIKQKACQIFKIKEEQLESDVDDEDVWRRKGVNK